MSHKRLQDSSGVDQHIQAGDSHGDGDLQGFYGLFIGDIQLKNFPNIQQPSQPRLPPENPRARICAPAMTS